MGSKSAFARAGLAAPFRCNRRHAPRITPRRWHPVVYTDTGPVRFAGLPTICEAMTEARSLAASLGARTFTVQPGRWNLVPRAATLSGGRDE